MLKRYIVILTLCVCVKARAQPVPPPGLKTVTHGVSMSGSGTVAVPLDLRTDCSSNQVLHWNGSAWTCSTPSNGITNGAGNLVIPVSDGTNLIASSISDNGTTVTMTEPLAMGSSKITRLANGSVSSDAAAFGQIATAVNTAVSGTSTDLAVFSGANAVGSFAGSSPSACTTGKAVTAAAISAAGALSYTCTTFSGGGITNSAGADVMPISDGTNLIAPTTSTQILVDGPTLQSFNIPSTSYAYGEVNRWEIGGVVPAYPADLFVGVIRNTASADTTTHSQRSGGLAVETTGSISAGSNGFVAVGIEALASGGTQNLAFEALGGDVQIDTGALTVRAGLSTFDGGAVVNGGLTVTSASTATDPIYVSATETAQTASGKSVEIENAGSYDTTSGALTSDGFYVGNSNTRSSGSNALTNTGLHASVAGAQNNYAILTDYGDVVLNNIGGITRMGTNSVYVTTDQTLDGGWGTNGAYTLFVNYYSYQGGSTQYRDLEVDNGKNAPILHLTGSSKLAEFAGAVKADSTVQLGGSGATLYTGTGVPSINCAVGDQFNRTDGGAGTTLYYCSATNTWTAVTAGGLSGLTTGYIPKAGSSTTIVNSAADDGITTGSTYTVGEAFTSTGTTKLGDSTHDTTAGRDLSVTRHQTFGGTAATTSNLSSCGTTGLAIHGNDNFGIIQPGSGATGCTFTLSTAFSTWGACIVQDDAGSDNIGSYTTSTTGFVYTPAAFTLSSTQLVYYCGGV